MKIELHREYLSGLKADADLHAGGLFFCIIYQKCLEFFEDERVELTKKLVDAFRPMDNEDVRRIENFKVVGRYSWNNKGYLECEFEDISLSFTGLPTAKDPTIVPFHVYSSKSSQAWGEIFCISSKLP